MFEAGAALPAGVAVAIAVLALARTPFRVPALEERLGYCSKSSLVADFELRLEKDGEYTAFEATAAKVLGRSWKVAKEEEQAEDSGSL